MPWAIVPSRSSIAMCIAVGIFAASTAMIVDASHTASNAARERYAASEPRPCEIDYERAAPVRVETEAAMIVDVSKRGVGMTHGTLAALVGLAADERLVSVDGRLERGWGPPPDVLGYEWAMAEPGDFIDLEIVGGGGGAHRRVLVVVHP